MISIIVVFSNIINLFTGLPVLQVASTAYFEENITFVLKSVISERNYVSLYRASRAIKVVDANEVVDLTDGHASMVDNVVKLRY